VSSILCDYFESSDHNAYNCPYRNYVGAICANLGKTTDKMTDKMVETMKERIFEYSHYFKKNRDEYNESDSS